MNYLRKSKTATTKKKLIFLVILLFFLIIGFNFFTPKIFSNTLNYLTVPFWNFKENVLPNSDNIFSYFTSRNELLRQNQELENRILEIEMNSLVVEMLRNENEELRSMLGRNDNSGLIAAAILAKPNLSIYDTFIVDAGRSTGVRVGNKVSVFGGIVIGEVIEVNDSSSKVRLFSTYGSATELLVGEANVLVSANGIGGGNFIVDVPREIEVEVGDLVRQPGIAPRIFGIIEKIDFDPTDSFKRIRIKNPVNIFELKVVEILID